MATHELKITPEHYRPVFTRHKTAELRNNDRQFEVDDVIVLREWREGTYTGQSVVRKVIHVADVGSYLPGYVLLSME